MGFFVFFLELIIFRSLLNEARVEIRHPIYFLKKSTAPPKRYFFICPFIPKVSLTSVASLTTGITELERVLL